MTEYSGSLSRSLTTIIVLVIIVMALALTAAFVVSKRIVRPLGLITDRVKSLGGDDLRFVMEDEYRTGDEVEALAESFAMLSAKTLEYVDEVTKVTAEKERIGAELNMATAIQASQLPRLFPAFPNRPEFDLFASMDPAKEVGGDFYDFFLVDDDHIALVMADVSGKGVPAALFMMVSRVLIKSRLQSGESPSEALMNVNDQLCEGNDAEYFVTVWVAVVQISTGKGVAANAGHEHPVLRRAGGTYELVVYRHAPALGLMDGIPFRQHDFVMHPGDSLFVYTDGVPEATNDSDELFGSDRMLTALNENPDASPNDVLVNVRRSVDGFVGEAEQFDDLTMLCFRYLGPQ
jgi:sigma-B regulation protein RsbU (phosphoserine phosphatase)